MRSAIVRRSIGAIVFSLTCAATLWALQALTPSPAEAQFGDVCSVAPVKPASPVGCKALVPMCLCRGHQYGRIRIECEWLFACER